MFVNSDGILYFISSIVFLTVNVVKTKAILYLTLKCAYDLFSRSWIIMFTVFKTVFLYV